MTKEPLLTVPDVVRLTNLAERTVRAMLADGRLEAVRPSGVRAVRIPADAVERLFTRRTTSGAGVES